MTTTTSKPLPTGLPESQGVIRPGKLKTKTRLGDKLMHAYTWLVILWLILPIAVMIVFSFNNTPGRYNTAWRGFTFKWYGRLGEIQDLRSALFYSLILAVLTMVISVALGTGIGLAMGKYKFLGLIAANLIIFAAISTPEIVLGSSLRSLFDTANFPPGFLTILIAHVSFSAPFVAVVIRARVLTIDPSIEEAAKDLGASAFATFWRVTLPMIYPAILSGGLLAFVLSIDDFVVTNFVNGRITTFPLWIWGAGKLGLPPQVNVMGTLIFAGGVLIAVLGAYFTRRRERR
jgi:spermidine/putrescine transport system permease protein